MFWYLYIVRVFSFYNTMCTLCTLSKLYSFQQCLFYLGTWNGFLFYFLNKIKIINYELNVIESIIISFSDTNMSAVKMLYQTILKRPSRFFAVIAVGSLFFERTLDIGIENLYDSMNRGVSIINIFFFLF